MEAQAHTHTEHYDPEGQKMGMWLFLLTELLVFGGLFIAYGMLSRRYRVEFIDGSQHLELILGAVNTVVLLTSSLTVVLSIGALQRGDKRLSKLFLAATIGFAVVFLVIKSFEWSAKFHHGIYTTSDYWLKEMNSGSRMFYTLYFIMTGLHGFHVIVGGSLLAVCLAFIGKGKITRERHVLLENCALFWHLVDVIWIFLFPLFYLVR